MLALDGEDWAIMFAALKQADKHRAEEMQILAKNIGAHVANTVAKLLS